MKSNAQQQLFKPLSNRTRAKPEQIYSKLSLHLLQLQQQVSQFNKVQQVVSRNVKKQIKRASSRQFRLKTMTQPKFQNLLLNFQLQKGEKSPKDYKLNRNLSTKSGKDFRSFTIGSNMTSFMAPKSNVQSKYLQSKTSSIQVSKIKNKTQLKSTMIHTGAQPKSFLMQSHPSNDINLAITQSILFDEKKAFQRGKNKKIPKKLKDLIDQKKKVLQNEWTKTERYRVKVSSCIGEEDFCRLQQSALGKTRIGHVINKIRNSRPTTANGSQYQHILSREFQID